MYGEISVEMLSESESPEWTIRKFRLGYVRTRAGPSSTATGRADRLVFSEM